MLRPQLSKSDERHSSGNLSVGNGFVQERPPSSGAGAVRVGVAPQRRRNFKFNLRMATRRLPIGAAFLLIIPVQLIGFYIMNYNLNGSHCRDSGLNGVGITARNLDTVCDHENNGMDGLAVAVFARSNPISNTQDNILRPILLSLFSNCITKKQIFVYPIHKEYERTLKLANVKRNDKQLPNQVIQTPSTRSATLIHQLVLALSNQLPFEARFIKFNEIEKTHFIDSASYMLANTKHPYIAFTQDHAIWGYRAIASHLNILIKQNAFAVLFMHTPAKSSQRRRVQLCDNAIDCTMDCVVFHRAFLSEFLVHIVDHPTKDALSVDLENFIITKSPLAVTHLPRSLRSSTTKISEYEEYIPVNPRYVNRTEMLINENTKLYTPEVLPMLQGGEKEGTNFIKRELVIGIPSVARSGNPDYLLQTVDSIHEHGIPLDKIYIHHGKEENHTILDKVVQKYGNEGLHLVPRDPLPVSIEYTVSRPDNKRVVEAFGDDSQRKGWRISEAHDFMWIMKHIVVNTNASYIAFNQDDAIWIHDLPNLDAILKKSHIISLYSAQPLTKQGVFSCYHQKFCGLVSLVFRRQALIDFLRWLEPRWKESPIDWSLEDFSKEWNMKIKVWSYVKHIGVKSSFKFNTERLIMNKDEKIDFYRKNAPEIKDAVAERCELSNGYDSIVFGIPTMERVGNPPYLQWTVEHMRQNCIRLDQIYVMKGHSPEMSQSAEAFASVYSSINNKTSSTFHLVSVRRPDFDLNYQVTRLHLPRLKEAFMDSEDRKFFRMRQVFDYMNLAKHLLQMTDTPFIGMNYDDAVFETTLPDVAMMMDEDGGSDIISLNTFQGRKGVCNKGNLRCGIISLVYRREVLERFMEWLKPVWKEGPLDWLVEDFVSEHKLRVTAFHVIVGHVNPKEEIEEFFEMHGKKN